MFDEVDLLICIMFIIRSGLGINEITITLRIPVLNQEFETCSSKLKWEVSQLTSSPETDKKTHSNSSLIHGI